MKQRILAVLLAVFGLFLTTTPARAADVVDEAISALQSTSVYVGKGTERTDQNSTANINRVLKAGDHIVIVLLPKGATKLTNDEVAAKLLNSLKEPSILGLYVNGVFTGHSNRIPQDEANKLVASANAIATDPTESATIFVRLVHQYQAAHPEPTPTVGTTAGGSSTGINLLMILGLLCAVGGTLLAIYASGRQQRFSTTDADAPIEIRQFTELADKLAADVAQVTNPRDRENMSVMLRTLRDVVAKTRRKRPQVAKVTASNLAEQLNIMRTIVGGYLDNQQYPNLRGARERQSGYSTAFGNFRTFAEDRMANLLAEDYDSLTFEINRWRPMDDAGVPSSLDLPTNNRSSGIHPQDR
ncbi:hypothetical protein IPM09_02905 [Candidatus Saccharibacteria bacterium]|nr:MAG: hypothetical protein IPM09_02905 [Candidatus Saccharibacteria bacterium]